MGQIHLLGQGTQGRRGRQPMHAEMGLLMRAAT